MAYELADQKWAQALSCLLVTINNKVIDAGGVLDTKDARKYLLEHQKIIKQGEIECPEPARPKKKGKRCRIKKSKSRNLLERLRDYENDTLRFIENALVPISNNFRTPDLWQITY
jgi:transposase